MIVSTTGYKPSASAECFRLIFRLRFVSSFFSRLQSAKELTGFQPVVVELKKDLPSDQLHRLFKLVGWSDGSENQNMIKHFNLPFINSTLVISAWENTSLIGAIRVLSDQVIRSVIYDLAVDPKCQGQGIGRELIRRCIGHFPDTEWLVQTTAAVASYYEKIGFTKRGDVFLSIPSKWIQ